MKKQSQKPTPPPANNGGARRRPQDGEALERTHSFERGAIDEAERTVELCFSSEYAVERYFGNEILVHDKAAMRLARLQDSGPVLVEHNRSDLVGATISASLDSDRKGRAVIRFGRGSRASEIFQDVVDGIRSKISVGYRVHKWEIDEKTDTWRALDWEPYEISFVSIPADPTAGVGRSAEITDARGTTDMDDENENGKPKAPTPAPRVEVVRTEAEITASVRQAELKRLNDLEALGREFARFNGEHIAGECIRGGKSVEEFRGLIFEELKKVPSPAQRIGLTGKEVKQFSLLRAIQAGLGMRVGDRGMIEAGAFELEVSREFQKVETGRDWKGQVAIPWEIFFGRQLEAMQARAERDLTTSIATSTSKFGYSVATDLRPDMFIEVLRAQTVLAQAGATMLPGLVGNVDIPRQNLATSVYWVAEGNAPTEGAPTLDKVSLSPKTVAAFVDYSRKLMLQGTPAVEQLVRNDLTRGIFTEVDRVGLAGTGSNTPTGVLYTSGIGSYTIGTNGGAPTWAMVVGLEKEVAIDNALDGALSFITNAQVTGKLRQTPRQSSGVEGNFILGDSNSLLGYPVRRTQQCPSNLSKGSASGTLSAMLFGNWADVLIALWSGIDLLVDPYTGSSAGNVRVTVFQDADIGVRHPESFAECNEILPT